ARQFVGRVATQRNEVGYLFWIDTVSPPNLFGPDARNFAATRRVQDCCALRGELKGISIAARHHRGTASAFLSSNRSREKVIRLETRSFGVCKPARGDKFRQYAQLLDQIIIKLPPALISGKHFATLCRGIQAVSADNDRAGPFDVVDTQQEVSEAE